MSVKGDRACKAVSDNELLTSIRGQQWRLRLEPPSVHLSMQDGSWADQQKVPPCILDLKRLERMSRYGRVTRWTGPVKAPEQMRFPWAPIPVEEPIPDRPVYDPGFMGEFLKRISPEIRPFLETFRSGQFGVWRAYCTAGQAYLELLESNPALGWMLAHPAFVKWGGGYRDTLRGYVRAKRTTILKTLGYNIATPAVERILRRVPSRVIGLRMIQSLRTILGRQEHVACLSHLPVINGSVVGIVKSPILRSMATQSLMAEVSADDAELDEAITLKALGHIATVRNAAEPLPGPFTTKRQVAEHARLVDGPDRNRVLRPLPRKYPLIPLKTDCAPNGLVVEQITSPSELVAESHTMRHCVQSYDYQVQSGRYGVYRVLGRERATLGLVPDGRYWVLDQLHGSGNTPVSRKTLASVMTWLSASQSRSPLLLLSQNGYRSPGVMKYAVRELAEACMCLYVACTPGHGIFPCPFPGPPFPGTDAIRPITSLRELTIHMHTVRDDTLVRMIPEICQGRRYLYAVGDTKKERRTVVLAAVECDKQRYWHLDYVSDDPDEEPVIKWLEKCHRVDDYRRYRAEHISTVDSEGWDELGDGPF